MRVRRSAPVLLASVLAALSASLFGPLPAVAQDHGIKLTAGDFGLGIGDVRRLDGLRLNFRDRDLELVRGINATIWSPYEDAEGVVKGLAVGLPLTGAGELHGVGLGAGIVVQNRFSGIGLAPIGLGAGGDLRGIFLAGVGGGTGGDMEGIGFGGVGFGVGGDFTGIGLGGIGVGAGGNGRGLLAGGVGVGVGGDFEGILVGGVGAGVGGELRGVGLGGIGIGASKITGVALAGIAAGAKDVHGVIAAPFYVKLERDGTLRGLTVSGVNYLRGTQRGLAIGIVNVADELHGLQVGLINIARNKKSFSVLPIANYCK